MCNKYAGSNVLHYRKNLQRNICVLLSQILSILSKKEFSIKDKNEFAYSLRKDFLDLISKDLTKEQWNDAVASHRRNDGTALLILLYYHFLGTGKYEILFYIL